MYPGEYASMLYSFRLKKSFKVKNTKNSETGVGIDIPRLESNTSLKKER